MQANNDPSLISSSISSQKIVKDNNSLPSVINELGEKANKLLIMKEKGINIPKFFVVVGNKTGELDVNLELINAFNDLRQPIIARSAHIIEGKDYSFSGIFSTYKNIERLAQNRPNFSVITDPDEKEMTKCSFYMDNKVVGLTEAYCRICDSAEEGYNIKQYLKTNKIHNFNPLEMNMIVMEQIDLKVFGMFVTSDQFKPHLMHIHYSQPNITEKQNDLPSYQHENGGIVTYDKSTGQILDKIEDKQLLKTLTNFGQKATEVERLFGIQQVEIGFDGSEVYLLQSRTINFGDPHNILRLVNYKKLSGEYTAFGYGSYSLPVIVVDSLESSRLLCNEKDSELTRLSKEASYSKLHSPERKAYKGYIKNQQLLLQEELRKLKLSFDKYILVIKDAQDVVTTDADGIFSSKNYDFINELARDAVVVIQGKKQAAIRHEDWSKVEVGGLRIIPSDTSGSGLTDCFQFKKHSTYPSDKIISGDILNILSNVDGLFIWPSSWD